MNIKKAFTGLVAIVSMLSGVSYPISGNSGITVPVVAYAADNIESGYCGTELKYILANDGTLTIMGNDTMTSAPWLTSNKLKIKKVILDKDVRSICEEAFKGCTNLTSVSIGEGIGYISTGAFSQCRSLSSVTMTNSVHSIGSYAFESCTSLTSLTIPSSVTSIGGKAFDNAACVSVSDNIEYVDNWAVGYKQGITKAQFKSATRGMAVGLFKDCRTLTSVTIPTSIDHISVSTFSGTAIQTLYIPSNIKSIYASTPLS